MKKIKRIFKLILILVLIILFIKMFFLKVKSNEQEVDDFLFFKLFSNRLSKEIQNQKQNLIKISKDNKQKNYHFKINCNNMDFKAINLNETIDKQTLIDEKIAPGTKGSFNIVLDSNQDLKYKIEFNSLNDKPKNLSFIALKNGEVLGNSNILEQVSKMLIGEIRKNEKINITINWYWNFESEQKQDNADIQDTKDSENIKKYEFDVCAIGEEIL